MTYARKMAEELFEAEFGYYPSANPPKRDATSLVNFAQAIGHVIERCAQEADRPDCGVADCNNADHRPGQTDISRRIRALATAPASEPGRKET